MLTTFKATTRSRLSIHPWHDPRGKSRASTNISEENTDEKNQVDIRIGGNDGDSLCLYQWNQAELGYEPGRQTRKWHHSQDRQLQLWPGKHYHSRRDHGHMDEQRRCSACRHQ